MHGVVLVATRHAARSDPRICDAHRDNEKNFAPRRIGMRVLRRSFVARAKTGASRDACHRRRIERTFQGVIGVEVAASWLGYG
jgi:hypothetical protein